MTFGAFHINLSEVAQLVLAIATLLAATKGRKQYEEWQAKQKKLEEKNDTEL